LERLERWGWILAIVASVSAITGSNLHDLQPATYTIVFFIAAYTFIIGFHSVIFYSRFRSWYSAPELIGRWWRVTLVSGYAFSLIGIFLLIFAYPHYPSQLSQVATGIYAIAQITFISSIVKIARIAQIYE